MQNVSYIPVRVRRPTGFGAVEPWDRLAAETDEVYLWRAHFDGITIKSVEDMQAIARAIGRSEGLGLDLRGIAVSTSAGGYDVDAVMTAKAPLVYPPFVFNDAAAIAAGVKTELASRFGSLVISGAKFDQITDDAPKHPALDFWLSHTVIWDLPTGLLPAMDKGQPTAAFARFEGLYQGHAEDGINLKPWPKDDPGMGPPLKMASSTTLLWVAGGAFALFAIYRMNQGAAA